MTKVDPNEMSFLDHLEDLRWHILRAIMGIVLAGSIAFIFKDYIFDNIIFGPKDPNFIHTEYYVIYPILLVLMIVFVSPNYHLEFKAGLFLDNFQHI